MKTTLSIRTENRQKKKEERKKLLLPMDVMAKLEEIDPKTAKPTPRTFVERKNHHHFSFCSTGATSAQKKEPSTIMLYRAAKIKERHGTYSQKPFLLLTVMGDEEELLGQQQKRCSFSFFCSLPARCVKTTSLPPGQKPPRRRRRRSSPHPIHIATCCSGRRKRRRRRVRH